MFSAILKPTRRIFSKFVVITNIKDIKDGKMFA